MKVISLDSMCCNGINRTRGEKFEVSETTGISLIATGLAAAAEGDESRSSINGNQNDSGSQKAEDAAIETYLKDHGVGVTNKAVIEALRAGGLIVESSQVTAAKERLKAS